MKTYFFVAALVLAPTATFAESGSESERVSGGQQGIVLSGGSGMYDGVRDGRQGIVLSGGSGMYDGVRDERQGIVLSGGSTMYDGVVADK